MLKTLMLLLHSALLISYSILYSTVAAANHSLVFSSNSDEDITSIDDANTLSQITSVSQLSDVQPFDWAFQALQSLVERYGCVLGYPDSTYRGNQAMTRYEFAAGLNSCINRVNELIATGTSNLVQPEDLAVLQRLQEEFRAELTLLAGRVDALESRTAILEKQQFSTVAKLSGEVIFAITDVLAGDDNQTRVNQATSDTTPSQNTVFANRVRLTIDSSFSGQDLLRIRLQTGNFDVPGFQIAAQPGFQDREGIQTFNVARPFPNNSSCCISPATAFTSGAIYLDSLLYRFPIGSTTNVVIMANAGEHADYTPTLNPYFEDFDGGNGSLSTFGQRSPIYRMGSEFGSGVGITTQFNDILALSIGYLANGTGSWPIKNGGLFDGSFSTLAQLTITPNDSLAIGLTYNYTYFTPLTNTNFGEVAGTKLATANTFVPEDTYNNSFGIAGTWQVSPSFVVNGWITTTNGRDFTVPRGSSDEYHTWSYALALAFPDLGKKGNLGGVLIGIQPYLTGFYLDGVAVPFPRSLPLHIEPFYKAQLTDNISLTAGLIWLLAPNQDDNNPDVVIGTIRTTFSF